MFAVQRIVSVICCIARIYIEDIILYISVSLFNILGNAVITELYISGVEIVPL